MLVLLLLPLAGCFGDDGPRLAQPTDEPIVPPTRPPSPTRAPSTPPNLQDPGYATNATWHVGDAWDYVAPSRRYHAIRVVESVEAGNTTFFRTQEAEGVLGSPPNVRYSRWIDGDNWTLVNRTEAQGLRTTYSPPAPERFLRNGTYRYNASGGGESSSFVANVHYTGRPNVTMPWGEILRAARFEHRIVEFLPGGSQNRVLAVLVFAGEWGNLVSYQLGEDAETYSLAAARYGVKQQGQLVDV